MGADPGIVATLRRLLLPIHADRMDPAATSAETALGAVASSDRAQALALAVDEWRRGKPPSKLLKDSVRAALQAGFVGQNGHLLAKDFFKIHLDLREKDLLTFDQASALLSHAELIVHTAAESRQSASQIARLLAAVDDRAGFRRETVERVLGALKLLPAVDLPEIEDVVWADALEEDQWFADAGVRDAAAIVAEQAESLSFPEDIEPLLNVLVPPDLDVTGPLLRLLYYQCLIAHYYDHPPSHLYEFSPRSEKAGFVFGEILEDLPGAPNAALNIAKSAHFANDAWARGRKDHVGALALARIFAGMDSMGFAARQELAAWLRGWVFRVTRLLRPLQQPLVRPPTEGAVGNILRAVGTEQTSTRGIVEQRVVDALASACHSGWTARGIGDSVNASNVSKRKFGDCEFVLPTQGSPELVAYEAHAGHLSEVYVTGHLRTLGPILQRRLEELELIDQDPQNWTLRVIFVAHDIGATFAPYHVDGFTFVPSAMTFDQLARAPSAPLAISAFKTLVFDRLNERRTPQKARDWYLANA